MATVIYSMGHSLDGFITGPDGGFNWSVRDDERFRAALDEVRGLSAHLLGRHLYETMTYWDDPEVASTFDDVEWEFARAWRALPKVVFSSTLTEVRGENTSLATGTLADEIARLHADPATGEVAIGGGTIAAAAAREGLIDEYRGQMYPVLVGGGIPFFAPGVDETRLELLSTRTFRDGVVATRYRVVRGFTPPPVE